MLPSKIAVIFKSFLALALVFSFQILDIFKGNDVVSRDREMAYQASSNDPLVRVNTTSNGKSIYIYSTHQYESYASEDVNQGARYLSILLSNMGYQVDLETQDFEAYKAQNGLGYNDSYKVSATFLTERLLQHGGYDLIIDFHRDSIPRNASVLIQGNQSYAKVMFVIGNTSSQVERTREIAKQISANLDQRVSGLSRGLFSRECEYNQHMTRNMILMEIGGQENTFEEVRRTLDVLSLAIDDFLQKEDI